MAGHAYYAPSLDQSLPKPERNPTKVASQAICRRPPAKRSRIRPGAFHGLVFRLLHFSCSCRVAVGQSTSDRVRRQREGLPLLTKMQKIAVSTFVS